MHQSSIFESKVNQFAITGNFIHHRCQIRQRIIRLGDIKNLKKCLNGSYNKHMKLENKCIKY